MRKIEAPLDAGDPACDLIKWEIANHGFGGNVDETLGLSTLRQLTSTFDALL